MKVMIIGHGYVGSAVASIFTDEEKVIIDPKLNDDTIANHSKEQFNAIFVCVDTPKENNYGLLDNILNQINTHIGSKTPVCCKSTANPNYYFEAQEKYQEICVLHSPEYLDSRHNIEKFQNQDFCILGGEKRACKKVARIFAERLKNLKVDNIAITDIRSAALIKYAENFFLSCKVTIYNELYKIHEDLQCESTFDEFRMIAGLDKRIGTSHTQVPGWDGKFGWGGHCFEKDNYELENFSKSPLVKYIRQLNDIHRAGDNF
jgi:UDP-glucose 6-dehydrogenase